MKLGHRGEDYAVAASTTASSPYATWTSTLHDKVPPYPAGGMVSSKTIVLAAEGRS
jgi:hypothetical protein